MKTRVTALLSSAAIGLLLVSPARADETRVEWRGASINGATVVPRTAPGGQTALRVSAGPQGRTVALAAVERPVIEGDVLSGDSEWRRFELPFSLDGHVPPSRLELNLVLPHRGTVWLGPVTLSSGAPVLVVPRAGWWSPETGRLVGAVGGTLLGLIGAVIGMLAGRGHARRLVLALAWAAVGAGFASGIFAAVAWVDSQPRDVWFPPALLAVLAVVFVVLMPSLKQRFASLELRRIQSADVGRGGGY